jgi:hypothetical protein
VIHGGGSSASVDTEANAGNTGEKTHIRHLSKSLSKSSSKSQLENIEMPESVKQEPSLQLEPIQEKERSFTEYPTLREESSEIFDRVTKFEHRFLELMIILFSNELHLLGNIVDLSHNIIMKKGDLEELIQLLTGASIVDIQTEPIIKGCLSKVKLYDQITRILVDGVDFHITKNKEYNFIAQYKICLGKCFV